MTTPHDSPKPRRRRSSLLDRWIHDQLSHSPSPTHDDDDLGSTSTCHPYLAYPQLSKVSLHPKLDDPDSPKDNIPIPAEPPPSPSINNSPPLPSRISLFSRKFKPTSRASTFSPKHVRCSSSHSTNNGGTDHASSLGHSTIHTSVTPSSWNWRPSVLGHFPFASESQAHIQATSTRPTRSRYSTSSYTSATHTSTDEEALSDSRHPSSLANNPHRHHPAAPFRRKFFKYAPGSASSPSLWSQPTSVSVSSNSNEMMPSLSEKLAKVRIPFTQKPTSRLAIGNDNDNNVNGYDNDIDFEDQPAPVHDHPLPFVAYSANSGQDVSRVLLNALAGSIRNRKKKKLVIRGIGINEIRKFDAAKRWCESFGEVSQITRMPNEDLHVEFKSADVAETVCRLRAKVFISGVGSVYLSWFAGNKQ